MRGGRADGHEWLRLSEAAAALGVSLNTVRRWSDSGKLTCFRSAGGHRRYRRADIDLLLNAQSDKVDTPAAAVAPPRGSTATNVTTGPQTPLATLAQVAADGVGVACCLIALADEHGNVRVGAHHCAAGAAHGTGGNGDLPEGRRAVVDEVLRSRRRVVIADVATTNLLARHEMDAYSSGGDAAILAVPVTAGDEVIGVMQLTETRSTRAFTSANIAFAEFIARQAARVLGVEVEELGAARPQTQAFGAATEPAAGAARRPEDGRALLHSLVERLRAELGAVACDVLRYDVNERALTLISASADGETPPLEGLLYPVDDLTSVAAVLRDGVATTMRDLGSVATGTHLVRYRANGARSIYCTPLKLGDDVIGLLEVASDDRDREMDREELALVEAAAAMAALALAEGEGTARLTRRLSQLDDLIASFTVHSPASDAEGLVRAALRALHQHSGLSHVTLYRIAGAAVTAAATASDVEPPAATASWLLDDYPPAARAVAERRTVSVTAADDPTLGPAAARFLTSRGLGGVTLIPLVFWDRLLGLLEIGCADPEDLATATRPVAAVAGLLAATLGGGDAITRLQRRNRDLALVVEAGLEDTARLSTEEVLHAVVERLAQLTHSAVVDVYAVEGDTLRALVSYDNGRIDEEWEGVVIPLPRYPCSLRAAETRDIAIVPSLDDPALSGDGRYSLEKWGYQSQLSMPLISGGRVLGLIELSDYVPRDFAADLELVRGLGQVAGHALENAALFEQLERRSRVLNELVTLGTLANRSRDLEALLRRVAEQLLGAVDAAYCEIYRKDGDDLRCVSSCDRNGCDEAPVGRLLDLETYSTVARAMAAKQVLVISSPDDPQLSAAERSAYREQHFASEVCIPLIVNDELYGLIDIYDTAARDYGEYLSFLRSAGQTLAGAFENALLVADLERRNAALAEIVELGKVVSGAGGLEELVHAVGPRVVSVLEADGCQIFTVEGDQLNCLLTYDDGESDSEYAQEPLDLYHFPSTAEMLETRVPLIISGPDDPRLSDYERGLFEETHYKSEICVPLIANDRVVGLLDVYDHRERDYAEHVDFLTGVGQIVAGAFSNAILAERAETSNRALSLLAESGLELGATLDLEEVLEAVARRLCAATSAPVCDIYRIEDGLFRCVASNENGEPDREFVGTTYPVAKLGLVIETLECQRPVVVNDLANDPRLSEYERGEDMSWGYRAKLYLPLVSKGDVIGIASVYDDHLRDFDNLDLVQSLAQAAANALTNATLFDRLDRTAARMTLVNEVNFELSSSLDLEQVLMSTANRLCAVADMPWCDIYVLREDVLTSVVSVQDGIINEAWQGHTFPLSGWATVETAVRTREPVIVTDRDSDPLLLPGERALMEEQGETAALILPLLAKDRLVGVLELSDTRGPRQFTKEEVDSVDAVCRVAALAIDNADLVEDLRVRHNEAELLNEVARASGTSLDLRDIADGVIEKLRQLMPFDRGLLALHREGDFYDVAYSTERSGLPMPKVLEFPASAELVERLTRARVLTLRLPEDIPSEQLRPHLEGMRSVVLIGLTSGDDLIGALGLASASADAFAALDRHLLERVGVHLGLAVHNARLYDDIKRMHLNNLKALSSALNAKDYYTLGHAARVAAYTTLLGDELGWSGEFSRKVEEAAYLHDIGKIGVSDRVLLKPSGLNGQEWGLMRQHPIFSADIIRPLFEESLVAGVRHHHERWDGAGYPDGLAREKIPIIARAMCVADSYDAMSFRRPYRHALTYPECVTELHRCSGSQFDPGMVAAFLRVLERIDEDRKIATGVAHKAAALVDAEQHARLRRPDDEGLPEYAALNETLRGVCAAHPPTHSISTQIRVGKKTIMVCDSDPTPSERAHIGDETAADQELVEMFAGRTADMNVLFVDRWGVWISGIAPVLDRDRRVAAVVSADIPAGRSDSGMEGLRSNVTQTFASMLQTAASQAGRSEIEAITDGLTGLYNHRYFHERLAEEIDRCQNEGAEMSLLLCDLDNFRAYNARHGHSAGDLALRAMSRVLERSVRQVDLTARYGGQEFAAILIDTGEKGALEVAERICESLKESREAGDTPPLTVSIGVASCPSDALHKEELIDKADWAKYLAKRRGRGRVETFGATHGTATPEQAAMVDTDYVRAMSEVVTARHTYAQRRRSAIAHLSLAVGRELGFEAVELRALAAAADRPTGAPVDPLDPVQQVIAMTAAFQELVAERPYRAQLSEAEALTELLDCPGIPADTDVALAFTQVLSRSRHS